MRLEDVIGHDSIKKHLRDAIESGRISHAVMFTGATGSGILPLAIAYASELIVHHSSNQEAARIKTDKLIHADLHLSYPVNTNQRVKKDPKSGDYIAEFRELFTSNPYMNLFEWLQYLGIENKQGIINVHQAAEVNRELSLKAFEGGYKVMVIWMPERLHLSAANKLLKILEEPPEKTVFVLASEQPDLLLPTIISRTQIIRVPPLDESIIKDVLIQKHGLNQELASSVALLSEGSYSTALQTLEQSEEELQFKSAFQDWMRMLYSKKIYEVLKFVEEIARFGRERQKQFIAYGLHIFRECLMMNYGSADLMRLDESEKKFVNNFAPFVNAANAMQMVHEFEEASFHVERNANPKILFLDLSLRIMKLIRVKPNA